MGLLLIDNFDSFTYNLVHYVERAGVVVEVVTNDSIPFNRLMEFDGFILSPGPGLPETSGDLMQGIHAILSLQKPVFGVCLGMQALAVYFGDTLYNQVQVKHGIQEFATHSESCLFQHVSNPYQVGLYHSWAVSLQENSVFQPTSYSDAGVLMSMECKEKNIYGVQFHPESILTPEGNQIILNFLNTIK